MGIDRVGLMKTRDDLDVPDIVISIVRNERQLAQYVAEMCETMISTQAELDHLQRDLLPVWQQALQDVNMIIMTSIENEGWSVELSIEAISIF